MNEPPRGGAGGDVREHVGASNAAGAAGGAAGARGGGRRRAERKGSKADGQPRPSAAHGLIDIGETARLLGTTRRHIRRLVSERRIPFLKVGRFVRFDAADLEAWLERSKVPVVNDTSVRHQVRGRTPRGDDR